MSRFPPLAFVDVETTGLSPSEDRIAEIGVVTVDDGGVERWSTYLRKPARELDSAIGTRPADDHDHAPRFADIADDLAHRLSGRMFVAHNARFDHAFVRAEFDRVGIAFAPHVVCSVMLSRMLYPHLAHHNLDALAQCHRLVVEERHRALPDAELVWQWWQVIRRDFPSRTIERALARLSAGPMLPPALDPELVDRLPAAPGAYMLHGEGQRPLLVGAAANLRVHLRNYFRIDQASPRALEYAHRVTHVTWRQTRGILGARLRAAELDALHFAAAKRRLDAPRLTWRFVPHATPCVQLVALADVAHEEADAHGLFSTERKARNALSRLALAHGLCRTLLGLDDWHEAGPGRIGAGRPASGDPIARKKALLLIFDAMRPWRIAAWPHAGPVGIRERSDVHVVDRWRFLGTARSEAEVHALLDARPREFDARLYRLLRRTMAALPSRKLVDLAAARAPASRA